MSTDHEPACNWRDTAWGFALGSTTSEEEAAFREHLCEGCAACGSELARARATIGDLDQAVAEGAHGQVPAPPPAELAERLRTSLRGQASETTPFAATFDGAEHDVPAALPSGIEGVDLVLASEGEGWVPTPVDGVRFKLLAQDDERRFATALVQMDPGAAYPPHRHAGREECYVLTGDLAFADQHLGAGDYQVAEEGSVHPVQSTENGCLLLIVSSLDDKPI